MCSLRGEFFALPCYFELGEFWNQFRNLMTFGRRAELASSLFAVAKLFNLINVKSKTADGPAMIVILVLLPFPSNLCDDN